MYRYIPSAGRNGQALLEELNVSSVDELFKDIPEHLRFEGELDLPESKSELEVLRTMSDYANESVSQSSFASFLGAGVYDHFRPLIIDHIIGRSEFYTAYTPYQAEISQGTLQAIFEYQSFISDLTGMPVSNASMYDGSNACVESLLLAINNDRKATNVLVSEGVNPEVLAVIKTYLQFRDIEVKMVPLKDGVTDQEKLSELLEGSPSCFLFQNPNYFGGIETMAPLASMCKEKKVLSIVNVDPISLAVIEAPGKVGIDIVVGDGQSLGNGMNFGGPYLGFMAVTDKLVRKIPGRIVGLTKDARGERAFVLTLQAREQHIRRYKATSNICSNQSLNTLAASIYLVTMGKTGLKEVAVQSHSKATYLRKGLIETGQFEPVFEGPFFKEFALRYKGNLDALLDELKKHGILGGVRLSSDTLLIAVTEKRTKEEMDRFIDVVRRCQ
ncbi:aminomethyl-transferring glycine dehydrogenase subunit GcvPA [Guggenheimella bovis]